MTSTIYPVQSAEIDRITRELFSEKYIRERLGGEGRWGGQVADRRKLFSPVFEHQFKRYLELPDAETFRSKLEPVAWHIRLESNDTASTLWALSEPHQRGHFEIAHRKAADATVKQVEKLLCADPASPTKSLAGLLFATFDSGTDARQMPWLHSDVFLMNCAYDQEAKKLTTLSNQTVLALSSSASQAMAASLRTFHQRMAEHFYSGVTDAVKTDVFDSLKPELAIRPSHSRRSGEALFTWWQEHAQANGFGPREAQAVLSTFTSLKGTAISRATEQKKVNPLDQTSEIVRRRISRPDPSSSAESAAPSQFRRRL